MDYGDNDVISFCGVFDGKSRSNYFVGSVNMVTNDNDFGMEKTFTTMHNTR